MILVGAESSARRQGHGGCRLYGCRVGRDSSRHHRVERRPILPRSLHRPLASTDGSRTENVDKTGVRLWAECRCSRVVA